MGVGLLRQKPVLSSGTLLALSLQRDRAQALPSIGRQAGMVYQVPELSCPPLLSSVLPVPQCSEDGAKSGVPGGGRSHCGPHSAAVSLQEGMALPLASAHA
jgi:hypothetical protein